MHDEPDRALLLRFARGDREAFEALFRHFERDVYRWIVQIVREPAAAEDALAEAFWHAYNRFYFEVSSQFVIPLPGEPLDRAIVFPMAVVPNMWGAWNMLYLALRSRLKWSLAAHGAILPLLLMPMGFALASALDLFPVQWDLALPMAPVGATVYYLAWKYLVGFLNQEVGIA